MSKKGVLRRGIEILETVAEKGASVHFIGVGGVSMSSLYCLTRYFGISATGSDKTQGELINRLINSGADVYVGERKSLPEKTNLVVYTGAVGDDNPELWAAREKGLKCVSRAEYLGALMRCYNFTVGISGSHGKSTVTAMIAHIFERCGKMPCVLCGAKLSGGLPFKLGTLDYLIYEACEYKDSFLSFLPDVALFLNIDYDHPDYFKTPATLTTSFLTAINQSAYAIINGDDPALVALLPDITADYITVGQDPCNVYCYKVTSAIPYAQEAEIYRRGTCIGKLKLALLGDFNIFNAVMASALAIECGIPSDAAIGALSDFSLPDRRLQMLGKVGKSRFFYDYAHHPTEIAAAIRAVKSLNEGGVTVIFRPHTFSRTRALFDEFVSALSLADRVYIADIDGIREAPDPTVDSRALAAAVLGSYIGDDEELSELFQDLDENVLLLGAADMSRFLNFFGFKP